VPVDVIEPDTFKDPVIIVLPLTSSFEYSGKKIDEIRTAGNEIPPIVQTIVDDVGEVEKFVSNDKIIESYAKQLKEMTNYKLAALETAKKIENTGRVRAGKSSSLMERGVFKPKK